MQQLIFFFYHRFVIDRYLRFYSFPFPHYYQHAGSFADNVRGKHWRVAEEGW